jgi:hypothetical protein
MKKISKEADISKQCTNHSIYDCRDKSSFEARHITPVGGHRCKRWPPLTFNQKLQQNGWGYKETNLWNLEFSNYQRRFRYIIWMADNGAFNYIANWLHFSPFHKNSKFCRFHPRSQGLTADTTVSPVRPWNRGWADFNLTSSTMMHKSLNSIHIS